MVKLSNSAATKALVHSSKYPHLPVFGVFLGSPNSTHAVRYIPLVHSHAAGENVIASGISMAVAKFPGEVVMAAFVSDHEQQKSVDALPFVKAVEKAVKALTKGKVLENMRGKDAQDAKKIPVVTLDISTFRGGNWEDPSLWIGAESESGSGDAAAEIAADGKLDTLWDYQDHLDDLSRVWME